MSHWKFLSGAIAIAALVSVASAAQADSYYGPRQVGDQCYRRNGAGESLGYWEKCPTGQTANAAIQRPATTRSRNVRGQTQTQTQTQNQTGR